MARTRVVATLGPATRSPAAVRALLDAGVDVVRLNLAHGTHEEHRLAIARVRAAAGGRAVAILVDLAGAKLRLDRRVAGNPGDVVDLPLPAAVRSGDPVLLADGAMQLEVIGAGRARVLVGGDVPAGKGINLPSSRLDTPALTDKDRSDLAFAVAEGVDLVGLSFVASARDLDEVGAAGVPAVAKIERAKALPNLAEIVAAADAVMVARGDLGVELPIERVPAVQKQIIALANQRARPVITATQMLRSMVQSRLPTRAEATDVVRQSGGHLHDDRHRRPRTHRARVQGTLRAGGSATDQDHDDAEHLKHRRGNPWIAFAPADGLQLGQHARLGDLTNVGS